MAYIFKIIIRAFVALFCCEEKAFHTLVQFFFNKIISNF
jgi:hypothetical protein